MFRTVSCDRASWYILIIKPKRCINSIPKINLRNYCMSLVLLQEAETVSAVHCEGSWTFSQPKLPHIVVFSNVWSFTVPQDTVHKFQAPDIPGNWNLWLHPIVRLWVLRNVSLSVFRYLELRGDSLTCGKFMDSCISKSRTLQWAGRVERIQYGAYAIFWNKFKKHYKF
jgi:hypothetical protein